MPLTLVTLGGGRLEARLAAALSGLDVLPLAPQALSAGGSDRRLLFAVHVDAFGPDARFTELLRLLRMHPACMAGSVAGLVFDGESELDTKQCARQLALALSLAGCTLPGKPLAEGTASLYNQHVLAAQLGLGLEETFLHQIRSLAGRVLAFSSPRFAQPRLLMLHASENRQSNTLWLGRQVLARLPKSLQTRELSLQNGTVYDCRGCSFDACRHFAESGVCFYGGAISNQVFPAILQSDALLFLCPNYNDAVSANLTALFNRLTNLLIRQDLHGKYLFGIVVSGYSGSDLVAMQLLGAMCMNKTAILPPRFCLMQTANDPGSVQRADGISARLDAFAAQIQNTLLR